MSKSDKPGTNGAPLAGISWSGTPAHFKSKSRDCKKFNENNSNKHSLLSMTGFLDLVKDLNSKIKDGSY